MVDVYGYGMAMRYTSLLSSDAAATPIPFAGLTGLLHRRSYVFQTNERE
jgi:hypothetical protein